MGKNFLFCTLIFLSLSTNLMAKENCLKKGVDELNSRKFKESVKTLNSCELEPVGDFVLYYRSQANLFAGNYQKAEDNLNVLFKKHPSFPLSKDARLLQAKTYFKQRRYKDASNVLSEHIIKRKNSTFKNYMLYCNSLFMANEVSNAKKALEESVSKIKKPADYAELLSWMKILKLHVDEETAYTASLALFNSGRWKEANQLVEQFVVKWPNSFRLKILQGRLKYRFDELEGAILIFNDVRKKSGGKIRNSASGWLATVYARMNDFDNAIKIRRELMRSAHGNTKLNLQHLIAFLYNDSQNHLRAINEWNNLLAISKKSPKYTAMSLWGLAWTYYKKGDYALSINSLNNIKNNNRFLKEIGGDRVDYWIARNYEKQNKKAEAKKIFETLKNDNGYYGWMSTFRLQDKDFSTPPWPKHLHYKTCNNPDHDVSLRLQNLEGIDEALRSVLKFNGGKNSAFYAYNNNLYDVSYSMGRSMFNGSLVFPPKTVDECLAWKIIYSRPYQKTVVQLTDNILPESLIYGIMMSESSFVADIESPVGAVGLMQIMPTTAQKIVNSLGVKTEIDLTNPSVNISLGGYYLRTLLETYPLHMTIASYNAGETAVDRWKINRKGWEIDQFIEDIPFKETRDYVKKVLARTWNYERMNFN